MDQKEVEMEDAGKFLEDEELSGEECVGEDKTSVEYVEGKPEESSGLVNTSPNKIEQDEEEMQANTGPNETKQDEDEVQATSGPNETEQDGEEMQTNTGPNEFEQDEEEMQANTGPNETEQDEEKIQANKIEQELPVDEAHDSKKDASPMGDDKVEDSQNNATYMDDDLDGSMKMLESNNNEEHQEHVAYLPNKAEGHTTETLKNDLEETKMDEGYESGTEEDQEAFMKEVEAVYKEKGLEFKPPKFYQQPLNCLKLWRSVIKLGGYDQVTVSKLWRQVGESFHPPKTCTTVSWTFRQFYEKALLEYERHKLQVGELEFPLSTVFPEAPIVDNEANGHQTPGRARRDAAARAMQGWHAQRLLGFGEEKNSNSPQRREKSLKSIGSLKQKRPSEMEHSMKAARIETSRGVVTTIADVGPPANWVKINVLVTKDCFEVYALVPGLLREEVRVQSDPAGRVVITGQPEQPDNPWGITPFKKVISLPSRIDPLRTSAVVSLHGRLLVRVPFEQSNI
ncbi:putative transcription factor & chromatin remodeling ARID family [Helianthus annuus]|nr:AT-rich interactive domain-containing protein 5 isoform X1 [Helianthus annuus]KAJ0489244.1 putative transcription factor & chromatin remodeling ARID family [Helianthus annuus]KAJ0505124.1 putative transcription factor & chromatin remodeling ARID family [Helianthus annuus]KAJ0674811.1 putative transcription factor & chromatin remodeling ARID family [Helianthus annuus]KAJ0866313.1 putative transcription factor & chromatin remodeling ARID family [Helianthus annuus]